MTKNTNNLRSDPPPLARPKDACPSKNLGGLKGYITSQYVEAANALRGKQARRRIVAYV